MKMLVLPGDGIGPEITEATLHVLRKANRKFALGLKFRTEDIGFVSLKKHGTTLRDRVVDLAKESDGVILGPVDHLVYPPKAEGGLNPSGELRIRLDLYANIRPARSRGGPGRAGKPVDLVIVRENTEGFYSDRNMYAGTGEFMPTPDIALSVRKITAEGCNRIARAAFRLAETRRRKVTAVHKQNVLKLSDALYLREVRKVAKEYPKVELEEVIVDAMAALLIRDPERFDVVVATNMFGDILSDEASELSGSIGLAESLNAGDKFAVAQAQHGCAPDIAGKGIANPTSLILSAGMLLDWLAERKRKPAFAKAAAAISRAVDQTLDDPEARTPDMKGKGTTMSFAQAVAKRLG